MQETAYDEFDCVIYPNPARSGDALYMLYTMGQKGALEIRVFTPDSREVYKESINAEQGRARAELNLPRLAPGIYYYRIDKKYGIRSGESVRGRLLLR